MLTLEVKKREGGAADAVRAGGSVPAVLYGRKEKATPISIDARLLAHVWKEAGQTSVVTLTGLAEEKDTLIKDVQVHPVTGAILHADFYVLEKGKKITVSVPLAFEGEAPAEKAGHVLVKALHAIEIEVAPQDLPHKLLVDVGKLENVGDHVSASDVPLPRSATLKTNGGEIVVSVTAFVEEKEEEKPALEAEAAAETAVEGAPAPAAAGVPASAAGSKSAGSEETPAQ